MKKTIPLFFCLLAFAAKGQSGFTRNISIPVIDNGPVELAWSGGINYPLFSEINLNNDNIPDLFVFDRNNSRVLTFINNGGPGTHCWEYAPQYADNFPALNQWAFLYDYNCDNKPDIFCDNFRNNGITQYRNDSQGGNTIFTLVDSTIDYYYGAPLPTNIIASGNLVPNFNDIDGDGDMDILGQQFQCVGGFAYYKNMSMEDYGNCDSLDDFVLDTYVWGDFTLRSGLYENVAVGSWNVSCFQSPHSRFTYEIAERDDTFANIYTIDIDGDGDKDALIGDSQADNSLLVINGGSVSHATATAQDTLFPSYNVPVQIHSFSQHAYVDADNDGLKDLVVSQSEYENKKGCYFYKNTGTNAVPNFNHVLNDFLQSEMIDVGESATPVLFDYNSDGLQDVVIGNRFLTTSNSSYVTSLTVYKNIGTLSAPSFELADSNYANVVALQLTGQIYPAFGDLDGDGNKDMILGIDDGTLVYFTNNAPLGSPANFVNPVYTYMQIDVGQASTPQLIDLNRDDKLDLVIGNKNGLIRYYENAGTTLLPLFSSLTNDTLGGIKVQTDGAPDGFSAPFVFEQAGEYRMLVSCMKGDIYLYGNIDGNLSGNFSVLDTVFTKTGGSRYGYNITVSGGDLNNDTLVDMLVGYYGGGFQVFYQDNLTASVSSIDKNDFKIFPNPVSDKLIVNSIQSYKGLKCELTDLTGRTIVSQRLNNDYTILDVSKINSGAYILHITSGKSIVTEKIIITR